MIDFTILDHFSYIRLIDANMWYVGRWHGVRFRSGFVTVDLDVRPPQESRL